ncbi:MAG: MGMT family protein [Candidatus Taylorbacteria bacterium]|nr:MGMT family protein [Candidatus Taylorbacteria bacterium]
MKNSFRDRVYTIAAKIPKGKVVTYGQLAKMAGSPQAARAVGMSMRCNTDRKKVPCHRVVASNGALTGYAFGKGVTTKKEILLKEGVVFKSNKVDLIRSQWTGR